MSSCDECVVESRESRAAAAESKEGGGLMMCAAAPLSIFAAASCINACCYIKYYTVCELSVKMAHEEKTNVPSSSSVESRESRVL